MARQTGQPQNSSNSNPRQQSQSSSGSGDGNPTMSAVNSRTAAVNLFSRVHVSDSLTYATDPLISGYSFIHFMVPSKVFSNSNEESIGKTDQTTAEKWLSGNALSISLPDVTISEVIIEGLQGQWLSAPGKLDIGSKTTSVTFWETYNLDIFQIIRQWVYSIREPRTGTSPLTSNTQVALPSNLTPSSGASSPFYQTGTYKGRIYWFMTDPSFTRILLAAEFLGIWPNKVPYSAINTDVRNSDKIELSIDFVFDKFFVYPDIITSMVNTTVWTGRKDGYSRLAGEKGTGGLSRNS